MKTTLNSIQALLWVVVTLLATGCSSSSPGPSNIPTGIDAGDASASAGDAGTTGVEGGATGEAGGMPGTTGDGGGGFVYFINQGNGTTTATLAGGTFQVSSVYGASGNAFKYVAPNYYGTLSNGFLAFPTQMTGDFSITAQVTVTAQNKANNACGIGVGMTTGFAGTDSYAYALMRNANNSVSGYYVSGAGATSAGSPTVPFTNATPLQLTFSRTGTNLTYGAGPVGGTLTTNTAAASLFTNGTTVYGSGPVYPTVSFNNVTATVTSLVIKDATGATVFDSATGDLVNYVPASLTLSAASVNLNKGASGSVTATALAIGGAVSGVTAVSSDPTIATVSVTNGATNSTITLNGLKGGVSTVTVTNTGDTSAATNTKTILVSVAEFAASDPYGSIATLAYPAPGAATAYADGELALTFDAPPTLNTGGLIEINKLSDGSQVDSIAFAGETQTFGTTVINVGSQLVRVSGNTVFFTPHLGTLAYGTGYYVAIPTTSSISGTLTGVAFNGFFQLEHGRHLVLHDSGRSRSLRGQRDGRRLADQHRQLPYAAGGSRRARHRAARGQQRDHQRRGRHLQRAGPLRGPRHDADDQHHRADGQHEGGQLHRPVCERQFVECHHPGPPLRLLQRHQPGAPKYHTEEYGGARGGGPGRGPLLCQRVRLHLGCLQ